MRKAIWIPVLLVMQACTTVESDLSKSPIVGSWEWVNPESKCREFFIFKEDGKEIGISGNRRFTDEYSLVDVSNEHGRYQLNAMTIQNSAGADCKGQTKDWVGVPYTAYVEFRDNYNSIYIFHSAAGDEGFGPLTRVTN